MSTRKFKCYSALLASPQINIPSGAVLSNQTDEGNDVPVTWVERAKRTSATFAQCTYEYDGKKFKVFVVRNGEDGASLSPPPTITPHEGFRGMLHAGRMSAKPAPGYSNVFFVIQPRGWRPYQKRFLTQNEKSNMLTTAEFVLPALGGAAGTAAGGVLAAATAGAAAPAAPALGWLSKWLSSKLVDATLGHYLYPEDLDQGEELPEVPLDVPSQAPNVLWPKHAANS